ncbi:secreted protein containing von Willebrand factor, type A domain protein [Candidatus Magnetomorum sp. HK-1]|nr:secreted protein containing von Willebrand factor, type A domain protein [Candidatus Magnetomorum sp. HK-1]
MGYRFLIVIFCLLLCIGNHSTHAKDSDPVNIVISQVDVYLPEITVYANLLDKNDEPVHPAPTSDHIKIKLDGRSLLVQKIIPFKDTREGVAYTILLDISKTMKGLPFQHAILAIKTLINRIGSEDRIAIITFGDDVSTTCDFSNNKETLLSHLQNIQPEDNNTHFYAAIDQAFTINKRRGAQFPVRKAILVITDGKDEGSGLTIDDLLRKNKKYVIPVYSIGYTKINPIYLDNLKRLSHLSGGSYIKTLDTEDFINIYHQTSGDIHSQFIIKTNYSNGIADGLAHQLILFYKNSNFSITGEKNIWFLYKKEVIKEQLTTGPEAQVETKSNFILNIAGSLSVLLIIMATALFIFFRKKKSSQKKDISDSFEDQNIIQDEIEKDYPAEPEIFEELEEDLPSIKIVVIKGKDVGNDFEVSIGKNGKSIGGEKSDISLIDTDVDDPHCIISHISNRYMIEDITPIPPTFLNGIPIKTRTILENGDTIQIGQSTLRIKI